MLFERATGPPAGGVHGARGKAFRMAVRAWLQAGWPGPPPAPRDAYRRARAQSIRYAVEASQDRLDADVAARIVDSVLAVAHARIHRGTRPSPDELVRTIENAVLDHFRAHPESIIPYSDEAIIRRAFGELVTPELYRSALAALDAAGLDFEFRTAVSYVDELEDPGAGPINDWPRWTALQWFRTLLASMAGQVSHERAEQ